MECPSCDCTNIETGKLISPYGVYFKADSSKFLSSKESPVSAKVCLNCGKLFDFTVTNINKLKK